MNKLKIITIISLIFLNGCATQVTNNQKIPATPKIQTKEIPLISKEEKDLLIENGYAFGIWSESCSTKKMSSIRYYEDRGKFLLEEIVNNKVINRAQLYEVKKITKGVIQHKLKGQLAIDGTEYIASVKTGFLNGKRMTFDSKILPITGTYAGKEFIDVQDGYMVKYENNAAVKVKPKSPLVKCD